MFSNSSREELALLLNTANITGRQTFIEGGVATTLVEALTPRRTSFSVSLPGNVKYFQQSQFLVGLSSWLHAQHDDVTIISALTVEHHIQVNVEVVTRKDSDVTSIKALVKLLADGDSAASSNFLSELVSSGVNTNSFLYVATTISIPLVDAALTDQDWHVALAMWIGVLPSEQVLLTINNINTLSGGDATTIAFSLKPSFAGYAKRVRAMLLLDALPPKFTIKTYADVQITVVVIPVFSQSPTWINMKSTSTLSVVIADIDVLGSRANFQQQEFLAAMSEYLAVSLTNLDLNIQDRVTGGTLVDIRSSVSAAVESAQFDYDYAAALAELAKEYAENGLFTEAWETANRVKTYALSAESYRSAARAAYDQAMIIVGSGRVESDNIVKAGLISRTAAIKSAEEANAYIVSVIKPEVAAGEWALSAREFMNKAMDYHQGVLDLFEDARAAGLLESAVYVKLTVRVDSSTRVFSKLKSFADESVAQFTKFYLLADFKPCHPSCYQMKKEL